MTTKARLICSAVVFLLSLALYTLTLAPTVTLVDSGELIVAAYTLGVAHPPGFPLYTLLAHAATLLPIGNVAMRVNFASALFAALAAAMLTLVVAEALLTISYLPSIKSKAEKGSKRKKQVKRTEGQRANSSADLSALQPGLVPALIAGLLAAFSRTLWSYATIAEVYTLNTLLILCVFFLVLHWRRKSLDAKIEKRMGNELQSESPRHLIADCDVRRSTFDVRRFISASSCWRRRLRTSAFPRHIANWIQADDRLLYLASLVFGLALGVHHVTIGLMLPALALLVYSTEGPNFFKSKRLLQAALFAFLSLITIYTYLPVAALRSPVAMNWGDPRTLERIWWHITGRQYQIFFSLSPEIISRQAGEFITLVLREFGPRWLPIGLVLACAGLIFLFRCDRKMFYFLVLVIAADLGYAFNYEIAEDKDAYYLPAFMAMATAAGFGALWVMPGALAERLGSGRMRRSALVAILLLLPVTALAANYPYNNRRSYFIAQDYVNSILSTVEPNGMLLTLDWQVYSPLLYLREVERQRRDCVAIDANLLRRSWYFDYLKREYPALMQRTREQTDAFLEDLRRWEREPEAYERSVALNQRINTRFYQMILAFVAAHIQTAPVYVTLDVAVSRKAQDSQLTQSLSAAYQFVPQGLVFQLVSDRSFHEIVEPELQLRGLADGALKFEETDVVKVKVLPVYLNMLVNRGRYLASHGHHQRAIEAYKQALVIDPGFQIAQESLVQSVEALRRASGAPGAPQSR